MKNIIENVNNQICHNFEDYEKKRLPEPKKKVDKGFTLKNEEENT